MGRRMYGCGSTSIPASGGPGSKWTRSALKLARAVHRLRRFAGFHVYDGHIGGDRNERRVKVLAIAETVTALKDRLTEQKIDCAVMAGGSYTFDLWPRDLTQFVSPGSWTYSSAQHDIELADLEWRPAAFVLTTVISVHSNTGDARCR